MKKQYRVDPDRIYLSGLRTGGFAAWDMLIQNPSHIAATIPISGNSGYPSSWLEGAIGVPIWVFHCPGDPNVDKDVMNTVQALKQMGGRIKISVFPESVAADDMGHDLSNVVWQDDTVWQWLLAQKR